MKYIGSCHCGVVRYEVDMAIEKVLSCNCSICSRKGSLLAFTPAANFKLLKGNTDLSDYQFGKKTIHHLFCKHCGVSSFSNGVAPDGTMMVAVNVRCLEEFDFAKLPVDYFDGKNLI
jgi:hypothetical protein